jgi:hypothetical protein
MDDSFDTALRNLQEVHADELRREYKRGYAAAMQRIQDVLSGGATAGDLPREHPDSEATHRAPDGPVKRKRAPKGLVRDVIIRELSAAGPGGLTPSEIRSRARTADERAIPAASFRSELRLGRDSGRYQSLAGGRYAMPKEEKAGGADQSHHPAFSFDDKERG